MSEVNEVVKRMVIYPVNEGETVYILLPGRKRIAEAKVRTISSILRGKYTYFYLVADYKKPDGEECVLQCTYGITAFKELEDAENELCYKPR